MWATRNATVKTSRFSCHGKIRFDSFHVERLTGWLRIRPTGDHEGQDQVGRDPGGARGQPQAHLRLVGARSRQDLVRREDDDEAQEGTDDGEVPDGQPHQRGRAVAGIARRSAVVVAFKGPLQRGWMITGMVPAA